MSLLTRLFAWLRRPLTDPWHTPAFPTRSPRGPIHFDGDRTVLELLQQMRADGRLGPVKGNS